MKLLKNQINEGTNLVNTDLWLNGVLRVKKHTILVNTQTTLCVYYDKSEDCTIYKWDGKNYVPKAKAHWLDSTKKNFLILLNKYINEYILYK